MQLAQGSGFKTDIEFTGQDFAEVGGGFGVYEVEGVNVTKFINQGYSRLGVGGWAGNNVGFKMESVHNSMYGVRVGCTEHRTLHITAYQFYSPPAIVRLQG